MNCIECSNEIQDNLGSEEKPLCKNCYDKLNKEQSSTDKSPVKKKKTGLLHITIVVLIIILASAIGLYFLLHSPSYTFKAIATAIENHDWQKFTKYVDIESFYNSTVKDALEDSDNLFAQGLGTLMASNMKEAFIDRLKTQIEQPKEGNTSFFHQLFDNKNVLLAKNKVENKGKIVQVTIPRKTQYLDLEIPVIFNFRKEALHLTLTSMDINRFENVQDKIEEIITEHYNLPVKDSLKNLVKIEFVKKYKGCSNYVFNTCIEDLLIITTRVTNKSDFTIDRVVFAVLPKLYNSNWKGVKFQQAKNIKPGQSLLVGVNQGWKHNDYSEYDKIYMKTAKADIYYQTKEIWRKTKIGPFYMTMPMKEQDFDYFKDRIEKDKLTLEDILTRREEYGFDDGIIIQKVLSGEGESFL